MKIGLALSGGGALGAAHIGVIESLEQNNINIDTVSGTSAGAIIGLLYAAGKLPALHEFFNQIHALGIFQPKNIIRSPKPEIIFGKIENLLREITQVNDFSDLKIPFCCAATDIETGKIKIFDSGDPIKAVMASAAYPGVFPIQIIEGRHYIDGGAKLNLPVSPLKKQKPNYIIASSIYQLNKLDVSKKISRMQLIIRTIEIMENSLNSTELKKADFVFLPPVGRYLWYNFSKIEKIRQISEKYSNQRIKKLLDQPIYKSLYKSKKP